MFHDSAEIVSSSLKVVFALEQFQKPWAKGLAA